MHSDTFCSHWVLSAPKHKCASTHTSIMLYSVEEFHSHVTYCLGCIIIRFLLFFNYCWLFYLFLNYDWKSYARRNNVKTCWTATLKFMMAPSQFYFSTSYTMLGKETHSLLLLQQLPCLYIMWISPKTDLYLYCSRTLLSMPLFLSSMYYSKDRFFAEATSENEMDWT